jgi:hypothetical protein
MCLCLPCHTVGANCDVRFRAIGVLVRLGRNVESHGPVRRIYTFMLSSTPVLHLRYGFRCLVATHDHDVVPPSQ